MNLQTEEIEFENQLVDISPMETHLKKNLNSILKLSVIGSESELSVDKPYVSDRPFNADHKNKGS